MVAPVLGHFVLLVFVTFIQHSNHGVARRRVAFEETEAPHDDERGSISR